MSEFNPTDTAYETPANPAAHKDLSTGLVIFGIMTIVLGCISGLFAGMIVMIMMIAPRNGGLGAPVSSLVPGLLVYVGLAVTLIWLGIGSIKARRWARALLLIFSWSWLIMGVLVMGFMLLFVPKILAGIRAGGGNVNNQPPPVAMGIVVLIMALIFGFIFIVMPTVWTWFYAGKNVKATCEDRDPDEGWTDACPLPVLAFCLWLGFSAAMLFVMPFTNNGVMPFFGMFISGFAGTVFSICAAAVWGIAALMLYQLDERGWWIILIALCVFLLSGLLTYSQHSIWEMYHLMGYSSRQITQMKQSGIISPNGMKWMMGLTTLPFLIYLLCIKKFVSREAD